MWQSGDKAFFLGPEPGLLPRTPRRERRLVRFVHPSGLSSHELIMLRQKELDAMSIRPLRSTAHEIGLRAPKLHTPRDNRVGAATRDPIYLERRRRVLDVSNSRQSMDLSPMRNAETILASTRPSGVPLFGDEDEPATRYHLRTTKLPFETAVDSGRDSFQVGLHSQHLE
jgi:hypothetical protein